MRNIAIKNFLIGKDQPLAIMSGPCVIESEEHCLRTAEQLKKIFSKYRIHYIYKTSYDKANRSSIKSYRGARLQKGLRILEKVKKELDLPVVTDFHTTEEAASVAEVCDILQVPAFLVVRPTFW